MSSAKGKRTWSLAAANGRLAVRWTVRGGHLGFPAGLDLGLAGPEETEPGSPGAPPSLDLQLLAWLRQAGGGV